MTRRPVAVVSLVFLAACGSANPTSPSAFRPAASSSAPVVPPPTTGPNQGPYLLPGTPISVGVRTEVTVEGTDTGCFPNWDSSGHCRQFNFVAPADGMLRVTLELPSPSLGRTRRIRRGALRHFW